MQSKLSRYTSNFDIHTYAGRVDFLYCHYQQAVNTDDNLLDLYRKHFDSTLGIEDTIKRVGRALRAKNKGRDGKYRRDPEYEQASRQKEKESREYWREK